VFATLGLAGVPAHADSPRLLVARSLKGAWYPGGFNPLHLSSENPVSKRAFPKWGNLRRYSLVEVGHILLAKDLKAKDYA
jgi:hypothetical protein